MRVRPGTWRRPCQGGRSLTYAQLGDRVARLNYRPSLWQSTGGPERARGVNRRVELVDILIGNEEDFTAALGFDVPGRTDSSPNSTRAASER